MEITVTALSNLLKSAAELGANNALCKAGLIKPYLTKAQAYRMYGRANVDRWIKERLVSQFKDGNASATFRLSRIELDSVANASNRHSYLTTQER